MTCSSSFSVTLGTGYPFSITAHAATADSTVRSQSTTRDAVARLAVRSHLPSAERAHFGQYKTAKSLYDAVITRYSSPATAALSRLMLRYLFPDLAAFTIVADLITHLRTSDTCYHAALPTEPSSVEGQPLTSEHVALRGTSVRLLGRRRSGTFRCTVTATSEFAAALPHLVSMLLAPEGDPDAPDIPTPRSYAEAIEGPYSSQWQAPMDAEMASWKSTGTYVDEVPPPGANIVSGMWIFRVKRPPGSPPVFKARYVARGFSHRQGVDFFQTFSPSPKLTTLRVLLHVVAQRDYELHSLDFSTAFLQGSLHEEIWLRRPPGFTRSFPAGSLWSLWRPVYGLRQAPSEWHDTLRTTLAALGFAPSTAGLLLSSCEAEIYVGAMAAQELCRLTYQLTDLGEPPCSPPVLYVDNKAMFALCQEHTMEHRTKHIALRYFLARELQQRGQLHLAYVATQANNADIFTKALQPSDHQRFCTMLGLLALSFLTGLVTYCSPPLCLWGALAVIQQTTAAATTSAAAKTTAAAATLSEAEATTTTPAPIAISSSTPTPVTDTTPTPAQQLTPTPRDIHTSANITVEQEFSTKIHYSYPTEENFNESAELALPVLKLTYLISRSYLTTTRARQHMNRWKSRDMAFEAFVAWLPVAKRESGVKLNSFQDHFFSLDLLEQHLLAAETSAVAVGAARGTLRTPFFEGCSPSPIAPTYAFVAAIDVLSTEDVRAASASAKRRSSKGKGGKGGGGGSGSGGVGSNGGSGGCGGGGSGGSGGGSGGVGGNRGGGGGSGGSGSVGSGGGRTKAQRGGSGGGQWQRQQRRSETLSPEQLRQWSGVVIFDPDYDAILSSMYALSASAEGDYYWCVPPDPGIEAAALGAGESSLPGTAPTKDLHTFTLDSGASRCRHLATFTHQPESSLYTLATEPPQVAASAQVSASGQVAAPCLCRHLSHQTLVWHHRLGHPSLPRLRGMHSRLLVSGLPRSLPPLPPLPAPPCLPCIEGRQRAAPHFSLFPSTTAPLQTLHIDVWGPARINGQDRECYFLLVDVLIPWICVVRLQLRERFRADLPILRLHSDRGGEFSSDLLRDFFSW
ncbi:unnamed protein product [Closterium sp. NIES-53]